VRPAFFAVTKLLTFLAAAERHNRQRNTSLMTVNLTKFAGDFQTLYTLLMTMRSFDSAYCAYYDDDDDVDYYYF